MTAIRGLNVIAASRNQTLSGMALAWLLSDPRVTSVIIGASSVVQIKSNLDALTHTTFTAAKLTQISRLLP